MLYCVQCYTIRYRTMPGAEGGGGRREGGRNEWGCVWGCGWVGACACGMSMRCRGEVGGGQWGLCVGGGEGGMHMRCEHAT